MSKAWSWKISEVKPRWRKCITEGVTQREYRVTSYYRFACSSLSHWGIRISFLNPCPCFMMPCLTVRSRTYRASQPRTSTSETTSQHTAFPLWIESSCLTMKTWTSASFMLGAQSTGVDWMHKWPNGWVRKSLALKSLWLQFQKSNPTSQRIFSKAGKVCKTQPQMWWIFHETKP